MSNNQYDNKILRVVEEITTDVNGEQVVVEPVTLEEVKNYIRVTVDTADDDLITAMITTARGIAENYLSRDIVPKTRELYVDCNYDYQIELLNTPITSVDEVYIQGELQAEGTGYQVIGVDDEPIIEFNQSVQYELQINYTTAGLLDDSVIKLGVLSIIDSLYAGEGAGMMYQSILAPHKVVFI